jgi:hypothetical protein
MYLKNEALAILVVTMSALPAAFAQNGVAAAALRQDDAGIVLGQPFGGH